MQEILSTAWSWVLTLLVSALVFGTVIFIHELGHFLTAKFSGIRVNEFALGMGPRLFGFTKGDTVYSVRLFPIGGFVSMEGEDGEEVEDAEEDEESEGDEEEQQAAQPAYWRVGAPQNTQPATQEEEEEEVLKAPTPGSFGSVPVSNRILVVAAGAIMNIVLGFCILVVLTCMQSAITTRTVAQFYDDATSQQYGLQVGDTIVAVNGRRCYTANDISYEFARTQDGNLDLTVRRGGQIVNLDNVQFEVGTEDGQQYLVIDFLVYPQAKTFGTVVHQAANWTISLGRTVMLSLIDLVTGRVAVNNLSGPVGIVKVIGQASRMGVSTVLQMMALITINLGIFNLLPLPALDGGKLALLMVENIRKKPIKPRYEALINTAGMVLLIGLMVFVTFNDITKLF